MALAFAGVGAGSRVRPPDYVLLSPASHASPGPWSHKAQPISITPNRHTWHASGPHPQADSPGGSGTTLC
ncbi:hypothetical protein HaLaN_03400 [Haematococcus lacustris]|uniref:Uncharacterized protein n=1 Tax=Haematococcus lacustris TaxID=44745 RepID=A0A699YKF8_HAELA|nr:hypothetical protein HaLaN_03400 [Haematococcus lacustris]